MNSCMRKPLKVTTFIVALLISGLIVSACGGGGGSGSGDGDGSDGGGGSGTDSGGGNGGSTQVAGIGGTGISQGEVTGFGSIFVNDNEFNTDTSEFVVDGMAGAGQDDLELCTCIGLYLVVSDVDHGIRDVQCSRWSGNNQLRCTSGQLPDIIGCLAKLSE